MILFLLLWRVGNMLLTFQELIIENKAELLVLEDDFGQDITDLMAMIVGLRSVWPYSCQF